MTGPRNRADPELSNLVLQGGTSRPARLPPPNPGLMDYAEGADRVWPMIPIVLTVLVVGGFVALVAFNVWLGRG